VLDPWQSAQLAQLGPWGDGQWGGIDPDEIEYGTPLPELAERYGFLGDFLEAAALAGHTSAIFEGVAMTIRAHHAWAGCSAKGHCRRLGGGAVGCRNDARASLLANWPTRRREVRSAGGNLAQGT
jgi:hypothetical protein